jgi:hypothetical protein
MHGKRDDQQQCRSRRHAELPEACASRSEMRGHNGDKSNSTRGAVQGCDGGVESGGEGHVAHMGMACLPPQAKTASGNAGDDTASYFISYTQLRLLAPSFHPYSSLALALHLPKQTVSERHGMFGSASHALILPDVFPIALAGDIVSPLVGKIDELPILGPSHYSIVTK